MTVKVAVIHYSATGTVHALAQAAAEGAASARHGGSEATILSLSNVFYHWGALIVPPGFTDPVVSTAGGNPYGTLSGLDAATLDAARYPGRRPAQITTRLLEGGRVTDAATGDGNARGTVAEVGKS
jgi:NAD(P)H dehydrogenase (quinone)